MESSNNQHDHIIDMSVVVVVAVLDVAVLVFVAAADIASHQYSSKSSCILMLIVPAR